MAVISTAEEAEVVVKEWLSVRHPKRLGKVVFNGVMLEGTTWTIKLMAEVKGTLLDKSRVSYVIKVDSESTKVVGYSQETSEKR